MVYGEKTKELGCMTSTMRYFLMFVNLLFILAAITGIVISTMMIENKGENILKYCKTCNNFGYYTIGVFAALFVFSSLGFCALWKRNTCMLMLYAFVELIFFLASLCILIVIIMIHEGKFDRALSDAWNSGISSNPADSCDLQVKLNCSGWDALCPEPINVGNATFTNMTYNDTALAVRCPICSLEQIGEIAMFTETCHTQLMSDFNKWFLGLLGAAIGLCVLTLLSVVISCKVRVEYEEYEELSERF